MGLALMLGLSLVAAATGSGQVNTDLPEAGPAATTRSIGEHLMSGYILPFEMVSIVLLAALVGAAFLARRTRDAGEGEA